MCFAEAISPVIPDFSDLMPFFISVSPGFCGIFSVDFQVFSTFSVSPFKWNIACQNLPDIVYFS
jgi:hypothetical protein